MLVLSRQVGQAIVIDNKLVVTVERFTSDALELSLSNVRGMPLGQVVLSREQSAALPNDVDVIMIRSDADRFVSDCRASAIPALSSASGERKIGTNCIALNDTNRNNKAE